jgi:hypothetical protein
MPPNKAMTFEDLERMDDALREFTNWELDYLLTEETLYALRDRLMLLLWELATTKEHYGGSIRAFRLRFTRFWEDMLRSRT